MPRWLLVAGSAGAAGTAALLVLRPSVITNGLVSWRAWAFTALVAVAATLIYHGVRRLGAQPWLARTAGGVPVIAALAFAVLPAFGSSTVDEPLPAAQSVPVPQAVPATSAAPTASAAPAVAMSGRLRGIGHQASGTARLVPVAGGGSVVRLEALNVEAGPDYLVYLVPGAGRDRPTGGTRLARLKANRGNQNYPVPSAVTTAGPHTVLIWCRTFAVPIAAATLG